MLSAIPYSNAKMLDKTPWCSYTLDFPLSSITGALFTHQLVLQMGDPLSDIAKSFESVVSLTR